MIWILATPWFEEENHSKYNTCYFDINVTTSFKIVVLEKGMVIYQIFIQTILKSIKDMIGFLPYFSKIRKSSFLSLKPQPLCQSQYSIIAPRISLSYISFLLLQDLSYLPMMYWCTPNPRDTCPHWEPMFVPLFPWLVQVLSLLQSHVLPQACEERMINSTTFWEDPQLVVLSV